MQPRKLCCMGHPEYVAGFLASTIICYNTKDGSCNLKQLFAARSE